MFRIKIYIFFIMALLFCNIAESQVVINEVSNRNSGQIADEDNEIDDWIEVYNTSGSTVNLSDYYLSDDSANLLRWNFPANELTAGNHLLVFASGKNRAPSFQGHWESPVLQEHTFNYLVPDPSTPANWNQPGFIPAGWNSGTASFGFGDGDDLTPIPDTTIAVYIRKSFQLPQNFSFMGIALQVDYDDGFVAYLNGVEIARANINGLPVWNSPASAGHEAQMYTGGQPEKFALDTNLIKSLLIPGENIFAIEVHNILNSPDLSLIPYLSLCVNNSETLFDKTPLWLFPSGSTNLHTDFKISSKGEEIFLFNEKLNTIDSVWVNNLSYGWSNGRITDGADSWGIFIQPTPGESNTTKAYSIDREPEPIFSVAEGYYTSKQTVTLSTTSPTAQIRYTTDGSEPGPSSAIYSIPISVLATKVLRAKCYSKTDKLPGNSVSNTYFINNSGHTVPVLSIITNTSNLYGGQGIFDNWNQEWEKPCYVEYFDAQKQKKFEQFSGIQVDGGAGGSRSNPQHSFRLEFNNKTYGKGEVNYKLIPDRPERENFKSVYLRNGSNQWLTFEFKDAMECKMMSNNTNNYYSAFTPVVVYINGAYFGLYEMREKLNDEYFDENYKANIDSAFNLLSLSYYYGSVLRALAGSVDTFTSDYNKFLSLIQTDADYLQKADKIIDLDYYTDYIIAQSWIADTDWPFNNIKIVKGDFTDYRWRFILQDLEWALNPNGWSNSNFDHISYMLNYDSNVPYIRFWKDLIKNQTYKRKFINRFADIMNSSYLPENTSFIAQSIFDSSYTEMRNEFVRWNGGEAQANNRMTQYSKNMTTFLSELNNRSTTVRKNIQSNFGLTAQYNIELDIQPEYTGTIQINSITPEIYPWSGVYFKGVPIKLEAKGIGNYIFDGWVPNIIIKDINNPVFEADVKTSGYKFGAKFKLQTPLLAITISEINYSSGEIFPTTDWIELYNYGSTTIDLSGWYITDEKIEHKWIIPGSFSLKPNERLVLASEINKFNNAYPDVQNVVGSFLFGLGSPTDSIQLFNGSNKLIAGIKYSSEAPWPAGTFDSGMTLELKDPNADMNSSDNWFAGCIGGSPGIPYSNCDPSGISTQLKIFTASIYPNPATDQINIVLPSEMKNQDVSCRIFTIMGKEMSSELFPENSDGILIIPVENFPDGIYIVQISNGSFLQSMKFVKRRE